MRRRDRVRALIGISHQRSPSAQPQIVNAQAASTSKSTTGLVVDTAGNSLKSGSENLALELAIARHLNTLPPAEKEAFREASKKLTDKGLLDTVKAYDANHMGLSHHRPQAEKLSRFLGLLQRFMGGIAIAIQANPDISAIVVGGVRLVIDVAVGFFEYFTKLSEMLCRFGDFLGPLAEYAKVSAREDLVLEALAAVYGNLLHFCKHACEVFTKQGELRSQTSWQNFWRSLWVPFNEEFTKIESAMQHDLDVLLHSTQAVGLNKTLDASHHESEKERIHERQSFLDWISDIPFEKIHEDIYTKKHPGTGNWLIQTEKFREWFESPKPALLWCCGKPGVGKSVLASNVLEYVKAQNASCDEVGICFAYYDYQSPRDLSDIIRALIKQLCRKRNVVPAGFLRHRQDSLPSALGNLNAFSTIAQEFAEVFILLDGLDECSAEKRHPVLVFISAVMDALPRAKIFVTSRPEHDIVQAFERLTTPKIEIQTESVAADVLKYVSDEIERLCVGYGGKKLHLQSKALKEKIVETLTAKAEGMFLWVDLQITNLCRASVSRKDCQVEKTLHVLPLSLDATYIRAMDQIDAQPLYMKELAFRTFMWVIYAKRPLTIRELQHALATDEHCSVSEDSDLIGVDVILESCANLLVVDGWYESEFDLVLSGKVIHPIHYSVQEFLLDSKRVLAGRTMQNITQTSHMHTQLACTCLSHLQSKIQKFSDKSIMRSKFLYDHRLVCYAACSFDYHIFNSGQVSGELHGQISTFLRNEDWFLGALLEIRASSSRTGSSHYIYPERSKANASTMIHATELYKMPDLRNQWKGLKPSAFALHRACSYGSAGAVVDLLNDGSDVNERDNKGISPIQHATSARSLSIVKILLENGADINAQGGYYANALHAAAFYDHKEIVKLLLKNGADVNAQGGKYDNALQAAAYYDHEEIVKLLLENGADINAQGGEYGNALQAASYQDTIDIVKLLLENGADINVQGGRYGNALQAASCRGTIDIVKLLLQNGADITTHCVADSSLLSVITKMNHKDWAWKVLRGDINFPGDQYWGIEDSALNAATCSNHKNVVELLLNNGAKINSQEGHCSAVQIASACGHKEVAELLVARGADIHSRFGDTTALHLASLHGNRDVAELLLANGAQVDSRSKGQTGLQIASAAGNLGVVDLLISKGADIHYRYKGSTALDMAFATGEMKVVDLLRTKGAVFSDDNRAKQEASNEAVSLYLSEEEETDEATNDQISA